ncbi:MAG: hypothetical protein WKF73_20505 [Nocardioidaceae bacterium]
MFGSVAIGDEVIKTCGSVWLPRPCPHSAGFRSATSYFRYRCFSPAFAGLYFTVYAVTDETYRRQFFASIAC